MGYLDLSTEDVAKFLNPTNNANRFIIGEDEGQIPAATVETHLAWADDYVISRLPEKYRRHVEEVLGEIIVPFATAGQATAKLGLLPLTEDSVRLYLNWPATINYSNRSPSEAMSADAYSVNLTTGAVALATPLSRGDIVIADYGHSAFKDCLYLRKIALLFVQAQLVRDLGAFADRESRAEGIERQAYTDLDRLKTGQAGIQMIDRLKLMAEYETRNDSGVVEFGVQGGYL
jgi:hypothetical protein